MKKTLFIAAISLTALLSAASCSQEIVYPVTWNVTLAPENTYIAGEPVRFDFNGDVDNVLFYSGETNHQYKYAKRYNVSPEEILNANLHIEYQARYGYTDGLSVYVTDSFEGLDGENFELDKANIQKMVADGMPGWKELDYEEGASTVWTSQDYDISEYASNFVLAFHWHPILGASAQRHYWINGQISIDIKGAPSSTTEFTSIGWTAIMLNDEYTQGHYTQSGNPGFNFTKPTTAHIMINGCSGAPSLGGTGVEYPHDGWLFTKAMPLTKISNDSGVVVKDLQNYLGGFEYVFDEPGTYTVTFVGVNKNVGGSSRKLKEYEINIFPNDPIKQQ